MEKLMDISTAMIAFATIVGVAAGLGTFLLQLGISSTFAIWGIQLYILVSLIFFIGVWRYAK